MWEGFIDLHIRMVIKAVYRITRFMTEVRDHFSRNHLDIEFRACGNGRPLRGFHGSQKYYFGFCPIDGGAMMYQPIITKDNRVSFIQFSNIELHPVGLTSGAVLFSGQLLESTMLKKLLISFPISRILSPPLE